jgi:osomolarity two-component system, sensor histidine kinase NIK1
MDEYLSKPLQQNHLIQTILKCATLGGALLEKNRERELDLQKEKNTPEKQRAPGQLRPSLEARALTSSSRLTGNMDSPALVTADQDDPMKAVRRSLVDVT